MSQHILFFKKLTEKYGMRYNNSSTCKWRNCNVPVESRALKKDPIKIRKLPETKDSQELSTLEQKRLVLLQFKYFSNVEKLVEYKNT